MWNKWNKEGTPFSTLEAADQLWSIIVVCIQDDGEQSGDSGDGEKQADLGDIS
jgi:hypothetical protein